MKMHNVARKHAVTRGLLIVVLVLLCGEAFGQADTGFIIRGPIVQKNLAIYFIDRVSNGPHRSPVNYIPLDEALREKKAILHETGTTNLSIENLSDVPILVESGDIVKGGQQDRMIANDLIIPPGKSQIPVAAFCVEHDRSFKRGNEPLEQFSSSESIAPLATLRKHARTSIAVSSGSAQSAGGLTAPKDQTGALASQLQWYLGQSAFQETAEQQAQQQSIWDEVRRVQDGLAHATKTIVTDTLSPSSLELTLEQSAVQNQVKTFIKGLELDANPDSETIGFAYVVNGELLGAEIYQNSVLLRQNYSKHLWAAALEAILTPDAHRTPNEPTQDDVRSFLRSAQGHIVYEKDLTTRVHVRYSELGETSVYELFDREISESEPIHRSYLRIRQ